MAFRRTTPEAGAGEPAAAAGVIVPESDSLTAPPAPLIPTPPRGLTAAEVQERVATGRSNASDERDTRSLGQIVRANVITPFNGLLTTLFILIMITGRWQNALFGFVVIFNSLIGIIQEIRSRAVLDKLAVINAPQARVVRDGSANEIGVAGVVNDDLIQVRAGDQIVADGVLLATAGLEVDESLLTGESDPVAKTTDDEVRSGAFVVAGSGLYQATGVGPEAYAARLAAEARRYSLTKSELRAATNQLLRWISLIMAVTAPFIFWRQLTSPDNHGWRDALTGSVAALVGMVPDGLVLLTSMAFMLGVITLARRNTLVQELPAVEGLARVDVVCLDKTGTLTYGDISLSHVEVLGPELSRPPTSEFPALGGAAPPRRRLWGNQPAPGPAITFDEADKAAVSNALGLMSKDRANATAVAIAAQYPNTNWRSVGAVPFSSARKWASVTAISDDGAAHGTWVLGAPEMVFPVPATAAQQEARMRADQVAESGSRVLVLARAATEPTSTGTPPGQPVGGGKPDVALPTGLEPMAIVELTERIREDAPATLKFFTEQGVALKVISGDNPRTVGAVAARVGVPGVRGAEDAIDARTLPESLPELARVLENNSVFGRVTPAQKRAIVAALQSENHVVAMTGDGVNDALALKDADIGVAMGSGSPATRAVAQLVLLDGKFSHLPAVVAEGRRVIANIERAANLFLIKNAYALVLAVVTAITASAYPFEPIQLTLISALTIGIPGFFLALGPNRRRYVPGFMKRVLKFAIPTGVVVAAAAYASFRAIHLLEPAASAADGRTTATLSTLVVCLWVVVTLARPINGWKVVLVSGLGVLAIAAVLVPWVATGIFFLTVTWQRALVGVAIGAVAAGLVEILYRLVGVHKIRDESVVTIRASLENQRQFIEERRQETQTTDIIPRVGATRRIARAQVAGPRYQSLTEYAESQPNFPVSEVEDINRGRWNT